jgi:hypothetical protein
MEKAVELNLRLTKEEADIIRSSLCNRGLKMLCRYEELADVKGLSKIYWDLHEDIFALVGKIDREWEAGK